MSLPELGKRGYPEGITIGSLAGAGTLFVRSYERGERVHLAMLARGYDGSMPALHAGSTAGVGPWVAALAVPALAALALAVAW